MPTNSNHKRRFSLSDASDTRPDPKSYDIFEIGPHRKRNNVKDICRERPYFLVPLFEFERGKQNPNDHFNLLRARLLKEIPKYVKDKNITDVYVVSHGWHRNFYGAVSAYDRLVSRFNCLIRRDRLKHPTNYNPLFITFHWHSDPGKNGWASRSGIHSKESFLSNIARTFTGSGIQSFKDTFEDIFFLMNRAAADASADSDDKTIRENTTFREQSEALAAKLDQFQIIDAPQATLAEKTSAAWTCFYEADTIKIRIDQSAKSARFNSFGDSLGMLVKMSILPLGIIWLLIHLFGMDKPAWKILNGIGMSLHGHLMTNDCLNGAWHNAHNLFYSALNIFNPVLDVFNSIEIWQHSLYPLWQLIIGMIKVLLVFVVLPGLVLYLIASEKKRANPHASPKSSLPAVAIWLPMQLVMTLPALAVAFFTYLCGRVIYGFTKREIFSERFGKRNTLFSEDTSKPTQRRWASVSSNLSYIARIPLRLLDTAIPLDSGIRNLTSKIDYQLAFWEMQVLGTKAGGAAAEFICNLFKDERFSVAAKDARIHCAGHSFGSLVISNMIRHLTLNTFLRDSECKRTTPIAVDNVCLIQSALACNWFEGERIICTQGIKSAIACIYSRYDTAIGFYYPLANMGRCGAGFRGLYPFVGAPKKEKLSYGLRDLTKYYEGSASNLVGNDIPDCTSPVYLNIDASQIICDGQILSGGGHSDIFKDEVIEIMWAVANWPDYQGSQKSDLTHISHSRTNRNLFHTLLTQLTRGTKK